MKNNSLLLIIVFLLSSVFNNANAQRRVRHAKRVAVKKAIVKKHKWEKLGTRKVNFGLDRDVILVGIAEGRFSKLNFKVSGSLNMHSIKVHYQNGEVEDLNIKHNFNKKSSSRIIDINGRKRVISKVVFIYDTKNFAGKKAKISLFGRH